MRCRQPMIENKIGCRMVGNCIVEIAERRTAVDLIGVRWRLLQIAVADYLIAMP